MVPIGYYFEKLDLLAIAVGLEKLIDTEPKIPDNVQAIKNIEYKPMDVEEAVLQMELVDDNFLVFTNARSDQVNVLYRRRDGNYGLIQPSS